MLRLIQGFFVRRTGIGRTGYLKVRRGSVLPSVSAPRRAPRCASLSASTGRGSAFLVLGLGRTYWRMSSPARFCIGLVLSSTGRTFRTFWGMLGRAHFCILLVVLGLASWHRFFPLRFGRRVERQRSSLCSLGGMVTGMVRQRLPRATGSSSGCIVGGFVRCEQVWCLVQRHANRFFGLGTGTGSSSQRTTDLPSACFLAPVDPAW